MDRSAFARGLRDALPILLGIVPFALVSGVAATDAGLTFVQAMGLSVFVFAGASQVAALSLVTQGAAFVAVVVTAVTINVRMGLYSASLAPHFRDYSTRWKALLAYLLTDQAFALSLSAYREGDVDRRWYYLGTAFTLWAVWQVATAVGVAVGASVPSAWGLEFSVPLVFLALLVPAVRDAPRAAAAAVAAVVAVVGAGWPFNLGLLVGAGCGIFVGLLTEARLR